MQLPSIFDGRKIHSKTSGLKFPEVNFVDRKGFHFSKDTSHHHLIIHDDDDNEDCDTKNKEDD